MTCKVGAAVRYPLGRGRTVRFKPGLNAGAFNSLSGGLPLGLAIVAAFGFAFVRAARVQLEFPTNVQTDVGNETSAYEETFWKWGDPVDASIPQPVRTGPYTYNG